MLFVNKFDVFRRFIFPLFKFRIFRFFCMDSTNCTGVIRAKNTNRLIKVKQSFKNVNQESKEMLKQNINNEIYFKKNPKLTNKIELYKDTNIKNDNKQNINTMGKLLKQVPKQSAFKRIKG